MLAKLQKVMLVNWILKNCFTELKTRPPKRELCLQFMKFAFFRQIKKYHNHGFLMRYKLTIS